MVKIRTILFFFFSSRRRHTRSDRDWSSDVCSSDLGPAQRVLVADAADAIARPLQQECRTHFLHQIGSVVRGRAIDAKSDLNPRLFHVADRTATGSQQLVAAGAMADGGLGLAQTLDLL